MSSTLNVDDINATTIRGPNGVGGVAATITSGTITGITDLAIADGGTGASTAAGARTALGIDAAYIANTILTTTGDMIYASSANTPARLAAGTFGYVLTAAGAGVAPAWSAVSAFSTGDVKLTLKTTADSGWVLMNDTTIGNGASGGTGRANADTVDLFTLLWNNTADAQCAVSTGRGANAATDYAANKTIALPKALGRALATYGTGSGLTARALALAYGVETHPLVSGELASHTHTGTTASNGAHTHGLQNTGVGAWYTDGANSNKQHPVNSVPDNGSVTLATTDSDGAHTHTITTDATGSGTAHQNMQPTLFLNTMIKL